MLTGICVFLVVSFGSVGFFAFNEYKYRKDKAAAEKKKEGGSK